MIVYDLVKHAAVTEQIAREGLPFHDPFFARDGYAGYYYYFYGWPAAVRWASGFVVSARMAFAGCVFWTGFAVPALLWRLTADAGWIRRGRERPMLFLTLASCLLGGVDILIVLARWAITGRADPHIDIWNTEVVWMLRSTLWVPHHMAAVIGGWAGLLLAARAQALTDRRGWILAGLAGLAFASMLGLSVWIALALAPLLASWGAMRLLRGDWRLPLAGGGALIASLPLILEISSQRTDDSFPVAIAVRAFMNMRPSESLSEQLADLMLLPLNYGLEFGVFALGAGFALRLSRAGTHEERLTRSLLLWSAITSLLVASFLRSALINNDLGWRSILFAQIAAMVGTLYVAQSRALLGRQMRLGALLAALGFAGTIYDIAAQRFIRPSLVHTWPLSQNLDPEVDHGLRHAYGWADAHLPGGAVLQHNPALRKRMFDFGLYGRHWPAVADDEAGLFGASQRDVKARMAILAPIFEGSATAADIQRRGRAARVDYLLFTRNDPVWRNGLPLPCRYHTRTVCIAHVNTGKLP